MVYTAMKGDQSRMPSNTLSSPAKAFTILSEELMEAELLEVDDEFGEISGVVSELVDMFFGMHYEDTRYD